MIFWIFLACLTCGFFGGVVVWFFTKDKKPPRSEKVEVKCTECGQKTEKDKYVPIKLSEIDLDVMKKNLDCVRLHIPNYRDSMLIYNFTATYTVHSDVAKFITNLSGIIKSVYRQIYELSWKADDILNGYDEMTRKNAINDTVKEYMLNCKTSDATIYTELFDAIYEKTKQPQSKIEEE